MPSKKSLAGKTPKEKTKATMEEVMHEFKEHELESGPGGKGGVVRSRQQAIAIGLDEARRAGGDVAPNPNTRKRTSKRASGRKASK